MSGPDEMTYFFDEVRDGFFIPSMTKKCWAVNYKNLSVLKEFCAKEGLPLFSMWGTIIGAVRHGGYVPWDDDMDTLMTREAFNHILELEQEEKLPGEHWIADYEFDQNDNMTRSWVDTGALIRTLDGCMENYGFPLFDAIDIFILDTIPRGEEEARAHRMVIENYARLSLQASMLAEQKKNGTEGVPENEIVDERDFLANIRHISKVLGIPIDLEDVSVPLYVKLYRAMEEYCSSYRMGSGDKTTILTFYVNNDGFFFDKKLFSDYIDMPFEYGSVPVPIGYDGILRKCYGDYMVPVFAGGAHGYPFYREFEKEMKKHWNIEYFNYHFDPEEYQEILSKRQEGESLTDVLGGCFSLLKDAHGFIISCIRGGNIDDSLPELLGQCQELAVSMGERLETDAVGGTEKVGIYESYCDVVFRLYQAVGEALTGGESQTEPLTELCDELISYEDRIEGSLSDIRQKREIVLFCYRSEYWKAMHTIYEELKDREDARVIVIRVPYYLKNYDGTVDRDHMIIETEGYPEGIEFTDYDKYDFENRHPDVIVNTWPYDDYNESVCIHPYYFSKNLCLVTDRLVFLSPFVTREIGNNERLRATLSMFVDMPGLLYADRIIVQSDEMKKEYVKMLDRFVAKEISANPDAESEDDLPEEIHQGLIDFEEKTVALGSAIYDWDGRSRVLIYDEEKDTYYDKDGQITKPEIYDEIYAVPKEAIGRIFGTDGRRKKIFVLFMSGSVLFEHGKPAVDKMRRVMEQLADREDILVWWYMDPNARAILKGHAKETWNAFRELREQFVSGGWGYLDESWDDTTAGGVGDVFYGDGCRLMTRMREKRKPVMWETPGIPIDAPESYEDKKWTPETVVAVERVWYFHNFLDEAVDYKETRISDGNGKRIAGELMC